MDQAALEQAVEEARRSGIDRDARSVMLWARHLLGEGLMMTTSFQKGGMILLHLARELMPDLPVYFLDTGFHFPETIEFAERIRREWGINVIFQRGNLYGDAFKARYGELYETDPNLCCHLNKVEPQNELLARYPGWITAIRRDQASTRAEVEVLEILEGPRLKVMPLAHWSREQVSGYLAEHHLPVHPLYAKGYSSIGCGPCTQPSSDPANERAGRWGGKKVECGLHTFWKKRAGEPQVADARPAPTATHSPAVIEQVESLGTSPEPDPVRKAAAG